jgi:predicted  nucleic acid-binding Zn-ribbon protein
MEFQQILNIVLGTAMSVVGWFARELWAAVKELKADLSKLREDLPKTYISREDYRADLSEIKTMLRRIEDKLEKKEDK